MSKSQISKYSGCFAVFVLAVCIEPVVRNPTGSHWLFLAGSVVFFTLCFYFGLLLIAKYKSLHR
ncbi:hypothetical protein SAMN04489740_2842 [Arthrobacter alpinus]|uniref:Uncharacterized protein n=1 Tax=Arthrobacter alpinus TaxID=656366 RepID=A0A1H5MB14_9MICC|nr:hypothetical protein SAMN04489740_2842 [Arthrobacter alpinus]